MSSLPLLTSYQKLPERKERAVGIVQIMMTDVIRKIRRSRCFFLLLHQDDEKNDDICHETTDDGQEKH